MKKAYTPQRGDFIRLDFDPQTGHEQSGRRPALVISPEEHNRKVGLVVVCPVTSQKKDYPWEVEISENSPVYGVVLADQIKNLDWRKRNAAYIASAEDELVQEVVEKAFALLSPEEDEG